MIEQYTMVIYDELSTKLGLVLEPGRSSSATNV